MNQCAFRHSARSFELNASRKPLAIVLGPMADTGSIGGLAGPGEVQGDVVGIGPEIEILGDELAAVVDPDRLRIADLGADAFQGLHDILAAVGEAGIGGRTQPGVGIDDGQDAELLAHGELVVDRAMEPPLVRGPWRGSMAQTSFGPAAS
jgi:hypothetical protein